MAGTVIPVLLKKVPQSLGELAEFSGKRGNADALVTAGIIPLLANVLQSESTDHLEKAARILRNLAKFDPAVDLDDSRADLIFSSNIVQALVPLLQHKSHSVIASAALALATIVAESDQRSDSIVAIGTVPRLLELCDHSKDDVQHGACAVLASLCSGSSDQRIAIRAQQLIKHDAITKLCRLLSSRSSDTRLCAAKALRCVSFAEETREQLGNSLMPVLVGLAAKLGTSSDSDMLLKIELISSIIALLDFGSSTKQLFVSANGVAMITKVVTTKGIPPKLITACTSVFQRLSTDHTTALEVLQNQKLIVKLFPLLAHTSDTVRVEVLTVFITMSQLSDDIKHQLVSCGVLHHVATLISQTGLRDAIVTAALTLLEAITSPTLHTKSVDSFSAVVTSSVLLPGLCTQLSSESIEVSTMAICVVRNLCCVCNSRVRHAFVDVGVIASALEAIVDDDDGSSLPYIETLAYLCDPLVDELLQHMNSIRSEIAEVVFPLAAVLLEQQPKLSCALTWLLENIAKHSDSHADQMVEAGLLPVLLSMASYDDESVVFGVLGTVCAIMLESPARRTLVYQLGGGPKIAMLLASPSERCRVHAAEGLVLLCTGGDESDTLRQKLLEKNIIPTLASPLALVEDDFLPHVALFFWILIREGGDHQKAAIAAGAISLLTRFLSVSDEVANWRAAKALASLLEDYSCLYGVVAAGAVPLVVCMLDSSSDDCRRAAIECIGKLTFSNHIEAAEEAGVVPRLINLLSNPSTDTRMDVVGALAAIRNVQTAPTINAALLSTMHAATSPDLTRKCAEHLLAGDTAMTSPNIMLSAARKLIKLLSGPPEDSRGVVRSIAQCIDGSAKADAFVQAGLVAVLPSLLRSPDSFVRVWSSIMVRNLVVDDDMRGWAVIEAGVGPQLMAMVASADMHSQLAALFTIPPLVGSVGNASDVIGDGEALGKIVSLLSSTIDEVLVGACQTVQCLAHHTATSSKLVALGCTASLIRLFSSPNVSVVCEAALALSSLANSEQKAHTSTIVSEGAVPALVQALKSRRSSKVTSSTAFALSVLTERSHVASNAVVDAGVLSVLDSMLDSASLGMQELGADVFGTLFRNQDAEKRARSLLARNSMLKILNLLDSSSVDVRSVAALSMWHASKTEAGAMGLLSGAAQFVELFTKQDDETLQHLLVQVFANMLRYADELRGSMRGLAGPVLAMAEVLWEKATDPMLRLDSLCVIINLRASELPWTDTLMEQLLSLMNHVLATMEGDEFLAWAVVQPVALLAYTDSNKAALFEGGLVPPLVRLMDCGSDRVTSMILKALASLSSCGDVCEQVPGLRDRLVAVTAPPAWVADAAIILYRKVNTNRRQSVSSSLASSMNKRVMLTCPEAQETFVLWLRDRLQQLGYTVLVPDLRSLTTPALGKLQAAIDQCSTVIVCVDPSVLRSEPHRIFMDMCLTLHKTVVPIKRAESFELQGWLARLGSDTVLCFPEDRGNALALDALVQVLSGRSLDKQLARRASLTSSRTSGSRAAP